MHTAQALPDAMRAQPRGCARRCAACRLLLLLTLSASPPHSSLRWTARTTRRRCRGPCRASAASGAADGGPGDGLRVVVLGGGFGGLYAALRLNGLPWPQGKEPQVTLVDQSSRFVFKPLMYELLMGDLSTDEVAPEFSTLLNGTRVSFVQDTATAVVPDCPLSAPGGGVRGSVGGGRVSLASGQVLPYDWLVLALGATARLEVVPGAREHAIPFLTLDDVTRVQEALFNAQAAKDATGRRGVTVAVVGASLAGVELAAAVASVVGKQGGRVALLAGGPTVMPENTDTQRSAAEAALTRAGVEVVPSRRVASITTDGEAACRCSVNFQAADGSEPPPPLAADVVLWTAGQRPAGKELLGPEWLDAALGGISTDTCLRVRGHERMFALGDSAAVPSSDASGVRASYGATAQVAFQQADYCAWNVAAAINGRPQLPFRYQHLGDMLSLGPGDAAVNLPVGGVTLEGPLAAALRRAAYVYRQPTWEATLKVAAKWVQKLTAAAAAPAP